MWRRWNSSPIALPLECAHAFQDYEPSPPSSTRLIPPISLCDTLLCVRVYVDACIKHWRKIRLWRVVMAVENKRIQIRFRVFLGASQFPSRKTWAKHTSPALRMWSWQTQNAKITKWGTKREQERLSLPMFRRFLTFCNMVVSTTTMTRQRQRQSDGEDDETPKTTCAQMWIKLLKKGKREKKKRRNSF